MIAKDETRDDAATIRRVGPKLCIDATCQGCGHNRSVGYRVQGESGREVFCDHPGGIKASPSGHGHIGDTDWTTPAWCPLLAEAISALKVSS